MVKTYEFDVTLTCRNNECDGQTREDAQDQIHKLSKYHTHIIDGNIMIDKQNSSFKVEVSLRVPGHTLIATDVNYSRLKALDAAIEKTKVQLKKLKSKVIDHRANPLQPEVESPEPEESDDFSE